MISKNQLKFVNALKLHKFREAEGLFIAEGIKLVDELLQSNFQIKQIFATRQWLDDGHLHAQRNQIQAQEITDAELERISLLNSPNQVLAVAVKPEYLPLPDVRKEWVLLLDQIKDPGNLGTIIRTADWFGFHRIIASPNSVEVWNPKVVQASMGSVLRLPVHYHDLTELLKEYNGKVPVYGTLLEGVAPASVAISKYGMVVVGNESHGISEAILPFITTKISIPAAAVSSQGRAESLNASIATAIICYEIRRQHPV